MSLKPVSLKPVGLVFLGGTAGTALREGLSLAFTTANAFPVVIWIINIAGAFLLGLLLESLIRAGSENQRRRKLRLLLGTGFLGGFTTYSALATDTALLLNHGHGYVGMIYALSTVLLGGVASFLGIAAAARIRKSLLGSGPA